MLIVGLPRIEEFLRRNPSARGPMMRWIQIALSQEWRSIAEVRKHLPTADAIKGTRLTCFNIGGNSYRLLTVVYSVRQEIEIHEILTHAQYTRKYAR